MDVIDMSASVWIKQDTRVKAIGRQVIIAWEALNAFYTMSLVKDGSQRTKEGQLVDDTVAIVEPPCMPRSASRRLVKLTLTMRM